MSEDDVERDFEDYQHVLILAPYPVQRIFQIFTQQLLLCDYHQIL